MNTQKPNPTENNPKFKISTKKLKRALIFTALSCVLLLCTQTFIHSKFNADPIFEILSLQFPSLYSLPYEAFKKEEKNPLLQDIPSPLLIRRADADEGVNLELLIELLSKEQADSKLDLSGQEPKILIYHTHLTEAYFQTGDYSYKPTDPFRTDDNTKNVAAVGEKLANLLREKYGICVIHDTTDHEPPKLSTAYSRSEATMKKYREMYPSISMYIDVHRDAHVNNPTKTADYITIDGKEVARMMFVVGTGEGATGTGFDEMPDFTSNYALAEKISGRLLEYDEKLAKNMRVKTGRYNQHISNQCLLVEVGHTSNSLEQALNAVDYLAEAIAYAAGIEPINEPSSSPRPSMLPLLPK